MGVHYLCCDKKVEIQRTSTCLQLGLVDTPTFFSAQPCASVHKDSNKNVAVKAGNECTDAKSFVPRLLKKTDELEKK